MASIIIPSRWQPQGPVRINWNNPITRGLAGLFLASSRQIDLVNESPLTNVNAGSDVLTYRTSRSGSEVFEESLDIESGLQSSIARPVAANTVGHSIFHRYYCRSLSTGEQRVISPCNSSDNIARAGLNPGGASGSAYLRAFVGGATSGYVDVSGALVAGQTADFGMSFDVGDSYPTAYKNGRALTPTATQNIVTPSTSTINRIRWLTDSGQRYPRGGISIGAYWFRKLSADEQAALSDDPYQLIAPIRRPIFVSLLNTRRRIYII